MAKIKSNLWKIKTNIKGLFSHLKLKRKFKNEKYSDSASQYKLDKKLVSSLNKKTIPGLKQLRYFPKVLSAKELKTIKFLLGLIFICSIVLGVRFYFQNFELVPIKGGEYVEGLVGAPQYINPLLSQTNDVDSDISNLIFSGLLKYDKDLNIVPDMAINYQISEDYKTYTFDLRENVLWHDGQKLTADDVIFTFKSAQDQNFRSPLLISLRGVSVKKNSDYQVVFSLNEPYPSFLEVMTTGILPEHIWGEIPPINANLTEYNLKPIGSGPWKFKSLIKDKLGNIKSYVLTPNKDYYGQRPYLEKITFKFYADFCVAIDALNNQNTEGASYVPKDLKEKIKNSHLNLYSFALPQYTAIFFNQKNSEPLKDKAVRKSLALSIDKTKILTEALRLEGEIIESPILPGFLGYDQDLENIPYDPTLAAKNLDDAGWKQIAQEEYKNYLIDKIKNDREKKIEATTALMEEGDQDYEATSEEIRQLATSTEEIANEIEIGDQPYFRKKNDQFLELKLTTVNLPENIATAEIVKKLWNNIGVKVELEIVDVIKISREVIKSRNYDALLYGEIVGIDPDPYPFWHSSQNQDPGLNLAIFTNRNVDQLLEEARKTNDINERQKKYIEFQKILMAEVPAVFLYSPTYTYIIDEKIKGIDMKRIITPSDRFNNLSNWYIKTGRRTGN